MKKMSIFLFLTFSLAMHGFAQKEDIAIQTAVKGFFNGLSIANADSLRFYATPDFLLLEEGQVWNMDTLISKAIPPKFKDLKRVNHFDFIRIQTNGGKAWAAYWNTAQFTLGEKSQTVRWLESVEMKKLGGRWKIQLMHSTRLKPEEGKSQK